MLVFKRLSLNLLNIVTLLTVKVVLGDNPTRTKTISNIFKLNLSKSVLTETDIFISQLYVHFKKNLSRIIHNNFGHVSITRLKQTARKGFMEGIPENIPNLE